MLKQVEIYSFIYVFFWNYATSYCLSNAQEEKKKYQSVFSNTNTTEWADTDIITISVQFIMVTNSY